MQLRSQTLLSTAFTRQYQFDSMEKRNEKEAKESKWWSTNT